MSSTPAGTRGAAGWARALLPVAGLALLAVLGTRAWVGEDVLITYRSIDHWLAGEGLRYNVDERVQSYTHPLWMLLNTAVYGVLRHRYWAPTLLALACSLGAWGLLAHRHRARLPVALLLTAGWALSPTLVTWSTSGFENPLTFLLLAAFVRVLLGAPAGGPPPWTPLLALAGLVAVTRLDAVLLVAPALAGLFLSQPRSLPLRAVAAGALPVLAWALPSLLYFGFVLPNTAPAKLAAGIPAATYAHHGALYLLDTLQRDPVGSAVLLAALGVGAAAAFRRDPAGRRLALLAGGVLAYLLYTVRIGGCFLAGRFLAAPTLLALAVLAERPPAALSPPGTPLRARLASLGRVALLLAAVVGAGLATRPLTEGSRVLPLPLARATLGLDGRWHESKWARIYAQRGIEARERLERGDPVTAQLALGFTGIAAGPDAILVDRFALADPLLARLPAVTDEPFLAGHAKRIVPPGYLRARRTGSLAAMDPALAAWYARLRLVVSGPLWDAERLRTIADFHLGRIPPPLR